MKSAFFWCLVILSLSACASTPKELGNTNPDYVPTKIVSTDPVETLKSCTLPYEFLKKRDISKGVSAVVAWHDKIKSVKKCDTERIENITSYDSEIELRSAFSRLDISNRTRCISAKETFEKDVMESFELIKTWQSQKDPFCPTESGRDERNKTKHDNRSEHEDFNEFFKKRYGPK